MSLIFLSHSSQNNTIAEQVKTCLGQWGHRSIFLDFDPEDGIPAGRDWEKELYAKLRECRAVIVLCSQVSMASRWCFAEMAHAKALGKEVFPIKIDDCKVDPILTGRQIIDATAGWDTAYQRLEKGLLAAGLDPKDFFDWDSTRPLYPGLLAFHEQDPAIFFGRDKEIREGQALLNRLQQFGGPRLTLMLGASGSGKSSLMRAGLLPRLKRDPRWVVVDPFRPLNAPFDELTTAITKRFSQVTETKKCTTRGVSFVRDRVRWTEDQAIQSAYWFLELIKELGESAGSRDATVLLMIDQYEELLTLGDNGVGNRFLAFLRAVLDREDSRFMVLATLRSDFLASFQDHPAMRGLRVEPFAVPQMEVDSFASVIEGPAQVAGLELGPGLVQAMVSDTKTSDALPLLAFTLRELYEGFGQDKLLTLEEYRDQLGRLDGCIAKAAEAVLTAKPLSERALSDFRTALLSMVRVNDRDQYAKQPVQWSDLPASAHDVLERFVTARLLTSGGDKNGRTLEVAHEAFFRAWPRFATWIGENHEDFLVLRRAEIEAGEWERQRYDLKYLWHADQLKKLQEIVTSRGEKSVREIVRLFMAPQDKLLAHLEDPALSHQDRFTIGQYLATLGDRRPGVGLQEDGLPDIAWVEIPEGELKLNGLVGGEHVFKVKPFRLAKYQVTNEQFQAFLNAEDGHRNEEWRRDIPYDWAIRYGRKIRTWSDNNGDISELVERLTGISFDCAGQQTSQAGNSPREIVGWEDAVAFCRWLSAKTNTSIRLPAEWEWQQAATGGDPTREYPWKGGWDTLRCNSVESGLRRTIAVGMYPAGCTIQGVHDMAGNVWEWCMNKHEKHVPLRRIGAFVMGKLFSQTPMLRGGSWDGEPGSLRVSNRSWTLDSYRNFSIGFRLAQDIS